MKKFFLIACLCGLTFAAFAQEEKPVSDKTASPELSALQTAASLAKYGYTNYSATALVEAAKIFSDTKTQPWDVEGVGETEAVEEKDNVISYEPEQLIADAKKFAGKDEVVLAYINKVEEGLNTGTTRGAVGGPKYAKGRVYGGKYIYYDQKFWANELAEVYVSGDGDTDLDVYVYDANGNLISYDDDYTDECIVRWVPAWTGTFTIKVVNRGRVYNNYYIVTN